MSIPWLHFNLSKLKSLSLLLKFPGLHISLNHPRLTVMRLSISVVASVKINKYYYYVNCISLDLDYELTCFFSIKAYQYCTLFLLRNNHLIYTIHSVYCFLVTDICYESVITFLVLVICVTNQRLTILIIMKNSWERMRKKGCSFIILT